MICPSCGTRAAEGAKYCPSCGNSLVRQQDSDEHVGKLIAQKYRVEQLIGEGGMGKVYRANQLALDKPVVLKVLRRSLLSDERTVARFHREAKAASRLNHPNSISVLDFGQSEEGAMYIAMEYVNGRDLQQILAKEWPLQEARVARIMAQVLSALAEAHQAGVIHRDLKPENIMVEPRRGGENDFVKVLDFGIAKIQDSQDDGPALTRAGFVCGTPEYMSPEQARGAVLDSRSDLYAVGVILYQLLSGVLPFESDSAVGFATKHLTEEPLPPSRKRSDVRISVAMEKLILRALSKDPGQRPQTADLFRNELLALANRPVQSPPPTQQQPAQPARRANGAAAKEPAASAVLGPVPPNAKRPTGQNDNAPTQMVDPRTMQGGDTNPRAFPDEVTENVARPDAEPLSASQAATLPPGSRSNPPPPVLSIPPRGKKKSSSRMGLLVVIFVLLAGLGGGAYWLHTHPRHVEPQHPEVVQVAHPASKPLYSLDLPESRWDRVGAAQSAMEGDALHRKNELPGAAAKYREAFQRHPAPEYALKLGELNRLQGEPTEALGWWTRHLKDAPNSHARTYIAHFYPQLSGSHSTP